LNRFVAMNNRSSQLFVACPIYGRDTGGTWIPSDIQIGVTGKAKINEPVKMAVNRELGEELGICVPYDNIQCIKMHPSDPYLYLMDAKHVVIADKNHEDVANDYTGRDDIYRKLGVCVIGSSQDMERLLTRSDSGFRYRDSEPDIIGMIAIPITLAMDYVNKR